MQPISELTTLTLSILSNRCPVDAKLQGYIVIGTGPQFVELDSQVITKLKSYGIKYDILDTVSSSESVLGDQYLQRDLRGRHQPSWFPAAWHA